MANPLDRSGARRHARARAGGQERAPEGQPPKRKVSRETAEDEVAGVEDEVAAEAENWRAQADDSLRNIAWREACLLRKLLDVWEAAVEGHPDTPRRDHLRRLVTGAAELLSETR